MESLFGVSKKKLHAGVLDDVLFDSRGIRGRLRRFPFYFDPLNPEKKLQATDFGLEFAAVLTNFEPPGEERIFDSLTPFRDYSLDIEIEDGCVVGIDFRIDQEADSGELFMRLISVIDQALQSSHLTFVPLRE